MKMLKFLFPLSYIYKPPKKFFIALVSYIAVYLIGGFIPLSVVRLVSTVYVFIGAGLLMVNYLIKNRDDKNDEN